MYFLIIIITPLNIINNREDTRIEVPSLISKYIAGRSCREKY